MKRSTLLLGVILLVLIAIRIALPLILKTVANHHLASSIPLVTGKIKDVDLSILRGSSRFEGIELHLKESDHKILEIAAIEVSLAWRELLRGKIRADIETTGATAYLSQATLQDLKKILPPEEEKKLDLPIDLERAELKNGRVVLEDMEGLKPGSEFAVEDINARVSNLTPKEEFPHSFYLLTAKVPGGAPVKAAGKFNLKARPLEWDFDGTLRAFDLTLANRLLKKRVPVTFVHGSVDVFAEARSRQGVIDGYVKPFMKKLNVIRANENFVGPRHWGIEVMTAITNILLKNTKTDSLATRVPFRFGKGVKIDTGEAIEKAIQHGYESRLVPGLENKYDIE